MDEPIGWYSRGYLPHIDCGRTQFLTWRLHDAVPHQVLEQWKQELAHLDDRQKWMELGQQVEKYCDAGRGDCLLRDPTVARLVQETLFFDHGRRYDLHAWVVMPNHVHVLLTLNEGIALREIVKMLKGVSARKINRLRRTDGQVWQEDYFDRFIRDEHHFEGVGHYIHWNPVKAGLCTDPRHWGWSSANPDARARLEVVSSHRT
jgi:REP element-mobilizing transposase RayT